MSGFDSVLAGTVTLKRLWRVFGEHPLTKDRRIRAYLRFVVFQIACRVLKANLIIDWLGGVKLVVGPGMTGVTGELYTGLLEFEDSLFTLHLLRPGELFADVGANAGTYSLLASKIAHCHVIAFEPAASAAEMLRTNLALNGVTDQVEVVEKGVSDKASVLRFTTNKDALNRVTISEGPGTTAIHVDTLDALLGDREPSFIKIDVEGHEKQVIDGAQRAFASPKLLAIQIETGEKAIENEVLGLMTAQGYQPCVYEPLSRQLTVTKALSPHNTLFVRNLAEVQERLKAAPAVDVYGRPY
jgi:FkbM family methyltransferase